VGGPVSPRGLQAGPEPLAHPAQQVVVRVVVDVAGIDPAKRFDYLAPPDTPVGALVRVTLHGRRVGGWVVEVGATPPPGVALRAVNKVSSLGPSAEVVDVAEWAAWRWAGRVTSLLRSASPPTAVRGLPPPEPRLPVTALEALPDGPRSVVRLPPAADAYPLALAAAAAGSGDALMLCPSVGAAGLLATRLRRGGVPVALVPRDWARAAAGGCVVVGARAAAWAPMPKLSAVVVLDAHDEVYQEERAPTWNAWQVAAERARRADAPCVLVTPCPTLEQLAWGELVVGSRSDERAGWAPLEVVDRRRDDPRSGLFSTRLVNAVRGTGRVACVLNRKGRAKLLACAACGEPARCERCQARVESASAEVLSCPRCGLTRPFVCQSCGSVRLKLLRLGVARVREELEALVGEPVADVTAETEDVPAARVLVGTEALLHRLAPGDVSVVAFLDIDQELLAARYRAGEQALALLARASRLVGGRGAGGRVLVQTRVPTHEVLDAALHADAGRLAAVESGRRAALGFPPYAALAAVSGDGAGDFAAALAASTVEVLGPDDDGRYLLRAPTHQALCDALAATPRPGGRLRLEVDPLRV
jgi:primosomal protein N' (replication factor Y)